MKQKINLREMIKQIIKEEQNNNFKKAQQMLQPYIDLLREFKPGKIIMEEGQALDMFYFKINVPGQFEKPSIYIDIQNGGKLHPYHGTPLNTPFINVWFKPQTNKTSYKKSIQKVMSLLSSKNPKMQVLVADSGIDGNVKQWTNIKKIEDQYE